MREESNIALTILWICGVLLIVYILFIFRGDSATVAVTADGKINTTQANAVPAVAGSEQAISANQPDNEAFVFVNVNKKHFLTRFITINPPIESNGKENKTINEPVAAPVERVTKIIKSKQTKEPADFNIKPVSGI